MKPDQVPGPVFVGGTGRCGTHVVAALASRAGQYALVPAELRLHVARDGLPGFADGAFGRGRLLHDLRTEWWRRTAPWDPMTPRGVHRIAPRRRHLGAMARLAASAPWADRVSLSRSFVSRLLDPLARAPGRWVEKSPDNCAAAAFLHRLFPDLRLIHVVRDGRDVACSFMRVPWAPDGFAAALALWERRLLEAHRGTLEVPPAQVHRLQLEDLVARGRERSYRALLEFLEVPDEGHVRSFFEREVTGARAGVSRWRSDLAPSERARADSLYREALERLGEAGVWPLPPADQIAPPDRSGGDRTLSPIDPWAATTSERGGDPVPSF